MSSTLKKMRLVGEAELDRLKAKQIREYDPELHVLVRLQKEMEDILDDTKTSPSEKLTLLHTAQHHFKTLSNKEAREQEGLVDVSNPMPTLPEPEPKIVEETTPVLSEPSISGVLVAAVENLPKQYREKAKKFLDWMKEHKDIIKFDPISGRLVIQGTEISHSNAHDLLYNLYVKRTGPPISGSKELNSILSDLNVPQTLISKRAAYSVHLPKKGKKVPGVAPTILKVYDDV